MTLCACENGKTEKQLEKKEKETLFHIEIIEQFCVACILCKRRDIFISIVLSFR